MEGFPDDIARFKLDATVAEILDQQGPETKDILEMMTLQMKNSTQAKQHVIQKIQSEDLLTKLMAQDMVTDPEVLNAFLEMVDEALTDEGFRTWFVSDDSALQYLADIPNVAAMDVSIFLKISGLRNAPRNCLTMCTLISAVSLMRTATLLKSRLWTEW